MVRRVHRLALQVFGRLPRPVRRRVVRTVSPKYTAGAICLIERHDGHVLLIRQSYRKGWGIPGGLMRRGEDPADCARREVLEEVGLDIELVGAPAVVVDAVPQRIDVIFRARPVPGARLTALTPRSAEIVDLGWFPPDELPDLQFETSNALVQLARGSHPAGPHLLAAVREPLVPRAG